MWYTIYRNNGFRDSDVLFEADRLISVNTSGSQLEDFTGGEQLVPIVARLGTRNKKKKQFGSWMLTIKWFKHVFNILCSYATPLHIVKNMIGQLRM